MSELKQMLSFIEKADEMNTNIVYIKDYEFPCRFMDAINKNSYLSYFAKEGFCNGWISSLRFLQIQNEWKEEKYLNNIEKLNYVYMKAEEVRKKIRRRDNKILNLHQHSKYYLNAGKYGIDPTLRIICLLDDLSNELAFLTLEEQEKKDLRRIASVIDEMCINIRMVQYFVSEIDKVRHFENNMVA